MEKSGYNKVCEWQANSNSYGIPMGRENDRWTASYKGNINFLITVKQHRKITVRGGRMERNGF